MSNLTIKTINAAKQPGKLMDGDGLHLTVGRNQSKRWVHRFMFQGKRRDMGLGSYPMISLAEARLRRDQNKRLLSEGIDPIEAAKITRAKADYSSYRQFDQAAAQCIESLSARWSNAKHRQQWTNTINTYASPVIGHLDVAEIDTNLILTILQPIWIDKAETASRLRQRLETVLNWCIARGLREGPNPVSWRGNLEFLLPASNKVKTVKHHAAPPRDRAHFLYKELCQRDSTTAYAFRFLMLTACRTSEVTQAQWSEIDIGKRTWTIPADRMKARVEHVVPLTDEMLAVLEKAGSYNDTPYVFPGKGTQQGLSNNAFLQFLKKQFPEFEGTPHGIRSTFRDWAEEQGKYGHRVIETALAHQLKSKVERAYLRTTMLEQRRTLMDDWNEFLKADAEYA